MSKSIELERRFFAVLDCGTSEFDYILEQMEFDSERSKYINSVEIKINLDEIEVTDELE